jgi:hypothetical protein
MLPISHIATTAGEFFFWQQLYRESLISLGRNEHFFNNRLMVNTALIPIKIGVSTKS